MGSQVVRLFSLSAGVPAPAYVLLPYCVRDAGAEPIDSTGVSVVGGNCRTRPDSFEVSMISPLSSEAANLPACLRGRLKECRQSAKSLSNFASRSHVGNVADY
ncbi:hypothetical protein F4778DRAFT_407901 [Xylariomycetidae sp. FL2044]|nr:hypothetical protein F4778DRAFT_407901 [Xylariomycetidae sp. FL2044]